MWTLSLCWAYDGSALVTHSHCVGDMVVSFLSLGWGYGGIFLVTGDVVMSSFSWVGNIVVSSFCHWVGAMAVSSLTLSWEHVGVSLVTILWTWWDHPC